MKRILCVILTILCCFGFSSCYQDLEEDSLEKYILKIETTLPKYKTGYSNTEIDSLEYFLPNSTFFADYPYIDGEYYWREDDLLRVLTKKNFRPEISFLRLQYVESDYYRAKECMLTEIEPYNQKFYTYGNYIFYENSNFIRLKNGRQFPNHFTMACYNDEIQTLIFIGFTYFYVEEEYLTNIDDNWIAFIDTYYSEIYDFS